MIHGPSNVKVGNVHRMQHLWHFCPVVAPVSLEYVSVHAKQNQSVVVCVG